MSEKRRRRRIVITEEEIVAQEGEAVQAEPVRQTSAPAAPAAARPVIDDDDEATIVLPPRKNAYSVPPQRNVRPQEAPVRREQMPEMPIPMTMAVRQTPPQPAVSSVPHDRGNYNERIPSVSPVGEMGWTPEVAAEKKAKQERLAREQAEREQAERERARAERERMLAEQAARKASAVQSRTAQPGEAKPETGAQAERQAQPVADVSAMSRLYTASVIKMILLILITVGLYALVWNYRMIKNMRIVTGKEESCLGEFLLMIFIPFYSWYWYYSRAKAFSRAAKDMGRTVDDMGVLYLLLSVFGFGFLNMFLLQHSVNKFAASFSA